MILYFCFIPIPPSLSFYIRFQSFSETLSFQMYGISLLTIALVSAILQLLFVLYGGGWFSITFHRFFHHVLTFKVFVS